MICPKCSTAEVACPECSTLYPHGVIAKCRMPGCMEVPVQCVGCGLIVSEKLDGVLSVEMELISYEEEGEDSAIAKTKGGRIED